MIPSDDVEGCCCYVQTCREQVPKAIRGAAQGVRECFRSIGSCEADFPRQRFSRKNP